MEVVSSWILPFLIGFAIALLAGYLISRKAWAQAKTEAESIISLARREADVVSKESRSALELETREKRSEIEREAKRMEMEIDLQQ